MELSNTEIKIAVKNMAREMVKRAMARNAAYYVEYVKGGLNKQKDFNTYEEAEQWAKSAGLKRVKDPEKENEYRIVQ